MAIARACGDPCGRSRDGSASDVYDLLLAALDIDAPVGERTKPSCCDELGAPPTSRAIAEALADAVENLARQRGQHR